MSVELHINARAVSISGDLNFSTVASACKQALNFTNDGYEADLSGVTSIDGAGMAFLIHLETKCNQSGGSLKFSNIPEKLTQIAEIAGVEARFQG